MEAFIHANGGDVVKTVTNKCTHLMSSESGTKKCADAEKKGVVIVDEAWVREQCGSDHGQDDAPPPAAKKATKAKAKAAPKAAPPKKAKAVPKKAKAVIPSSSSSSSSSISTKGALDGMIVCMTGTMRYV